jgi:hypothetical protein
MIITTSPAFYVIKAGGEAAELIASVFSPGSMADIEDVNVISKEYTNDIEPLNELETSLNTIKLGLLGTEITENVSFNPLYIPMNIDELDDALEVDIKNDNVRFTAMDGNPYAIKSVDMFVGPNGDKELLAATVAYKQFQFPDYQSIMDRQQNSRLN